MEAKTWNQLTLENIEQSMANLNLILRFINESGASEAAKENILRELQRIAVNTHTLETE